MLNLINALRQTPLSPLRVTRTRLRSLLDPIPPGHSFPFSRISTAVLCCARPEKKRKNGLGIVMDEERNDKNVEMNRVANAIDDLGSIKNRISTIIDKTGLAIALCSTYGGVPITRSKSRAYETQAIKEP
ncbi:hypothetical protein M5K25_001878 [Dendrobium thyrsiflorum]|uniref:Uncharacterized protein n=1 Tax=Dendrobium thyrsiflorum TaxID=117978 RepID=A0ABD0VT09_DENTH